MGRYPSSARPNSVTEEVGLLHEAGMNGMIMGMIDYHEEMSLLRENVMPLMKEARLRHPTEFTCTRALKPEHFPSTSRHPYPEAL